MMLLLMFSAFILGNELVGYGPTKFDSTMSAETPEKDLYGYMGDHKKQRENKGFGDLSLVTFNMEASDGFDRNKMTSTVMDVLDSSHASVIALQYAKKSEIDLLTTETLGHYGVSNRTEKSVDVLTGSTSYLPILYDTQILRSLKSGYYPNNREEGVVYATWTTFEHKKTERLFTVINLGFYSAFAGITDVQIANILSDIKKDDSINNNPVIFMGNINSTSKKLKELVGQEYTNPLEVDLNAKSDQMFTMRTPADIFNDHERDFVLIRKAKHYNFLVNYARILRNGISTSHYPVHVIVSLEEGILK